MRLINADKIKWRINEYGTLYVTKEDIESTDTFDIFTGLRHNFTGEIDKNNENAPGLKRALYVLEVLEETEKASERIGF